MSSRPEQPTSDGDLLYAVARGDRDAFGALYDRYGAILFGIVLRILRNRAEAEDVLQETFLQIWQRAGTFDENRGRPLPWLTLLARSRALDRLRGRNLRDRVASDLAAEPEAPGADTVDGAIQNEESRMVRQALAEIPEAERAALLLAYFDGFTQSEIATRLEKPLGTVKTHTRLGLMRLRELLTDKSRQTEPERR